MNHNFPKKRYPNTYQTTGKDKPGNTKNLGRIFVILSDSDEEEDQISHFEPSKKGQKLKSNTNENLLRPMNKERKHNPIIRDLKKNQSNSKDKNKDETISNRTNVERSKDDKSELPEKSRDKKDDKNKIEKNLAKDEKNVHRKIRKKRRTANNNNLNTNDNASSCSNSSSSNDGKTLDNLDDSNNIKKSVSMPEKDPYADFDQVKAGRMRHTIPVNKVLRNTEPKQNRILKAQKLGNEHKNNLRDTNIDFPKEFKNDIKNYEERATERFNTNNSRKAKKIYEYEDASVDVKLIHSPYKPALNLSNSKFLDFYYQTSIPTNYVGKLVAILDNQDIKPNFCSPIGIYATSMNGILNTLKNKANFNDTHNWNEIIKINNNQNISNNQNQNSQSENNAPKDLKQNRNLPSNDSCKITINEHLNTTPQENIKNYPNGKIENNNNCVDSNNFGKENPNEKSSNTNSKLMKINEDETKKNSRNQLNLPIPPRSFNANQAQTIKEKNLLAHPDNQNSIKRNKIPIPIPTRTKVNEYFSSDSYCDSDSEDTEIPKTKNENLEGSYFDSFKADQRESKKVVNKSCLNVLIQTATLEDLNKVNGDEDSILDAIKQISEEDENDNEKDNDDNFELQNGSPGHKNGVIYDSCDSNDNSDSNSDNIDNNELPFAKVTPVNNAHTTPPYLCSHDTDSKPLDSENKDDENQIDSSNKVSSENTPFQVTTGIENDNSSSGNESLIKMNSKSELQKTDPNIFRHWNQIRDDMLNNNGNNKNNESHLNHKLSEFKLTTINSPQDPQSITTSKKNSIVSIDAIEKDSFLRFEFGPTITEPNPDSLHIIAWHNLKISGEEISSSLEKFVINMGVDISYSMHSNKLINGLKGALQYLLNWLQLFPGDFVNHQVTFDNIQRCLKNMTKISGKLMENNYIKKSDNDDIIKYTGSILALIYALLNNKHTPDNYIWKIQKPIETTVNLPPDFKLIDLKIDIPILVKHLTYIELEILHHIQRSEFVDKNWKKDDKSFSPNFTKITNRFNDTSCFIATSIMVDNLNLRVKKISYWIDVMAEAKKQKNYQLLFEVDAALSCIPVRRLRNTWKQVSKSSQRKYHHLRKITSPMHDSILKYISEVMKSPQNTVPCIAPFLTPLNYIIEGNQKTKQLPNGKEGYNMTFQRSFIKHLTVFFQNWGQKIKFHIDSKLLNQCRLLTGKYKNTLELLELSYQYEEMTPEEKENNPQYVK